MHHAATRLLRSLGHDARGNVLMMTGLFILILVAVGGAGVDFGRQQLVRMKLQNASDAAAVAAASLPETATVAERTNMAERYFNLNYPETYLGVARPTPQINVTDTVYVRATADVPTNFVQNVGVQNMDAAGSTRIAIAAKSIGEDYDVVVVVDESGSTGTLMSYGAHPPGSPGGPPGEDDDEEGFDPNDPEGDPEDARNQINGPLLAWLMPLLELLVNPAVAQEDLRTRMDVEKEALLTMVGNILPGQSSNGNVRLGMVGYTGCISNKGALTGSRTTALSYVEKLRPRGANYDHWGMEAGANMVNGRSGDASVCVNGTDQNTGVPSPATPRSDGRATSDNKIIVLLTDGYIMVEPPPCGPGGGQPCPNYPVFVDSCEQAKAEGAIIYTIAFVSNAPGDEAALKACASDDGKGGKRYFFAPDEATLRNALGNVSSTVRQMRVIE